MVKLNLGCGEDRLEGWENLDLPEFDLRNRWAMPSRSVEYILLKHVLEHLDGEAIQHVMQQAARVLRPLGRMEIRVPFYRCLDMLADPTHKTPFELETWDFVEGYSDLPLLSLELKVQPFPLIGLPESYRFSDRSWSKLVWAAQALTETLNVLIVEERLRFLQEAVPPWMRVEWLAVFKKSGDPE